MLSVCIPVYNELVEALVKALYYQKRKLGELVEIIVIDDCSETLIKEQNRKLGKYIDIYVELEENVGRPKIRNLFVKYATKPNLLFIDSDSLIYDSEFLSNYIQVLKDNGGYVVLGGALYSQKKPNRDKLLKWKYGSKVESKTAEERSKYPYRSFLTKNVVIPLEVLKRIPFYEKLLTYGHDDTYMGYELKKAKIKIIHIDNFVVNSDELDNNELFLKKSIEAVEGVFFILKKVNGDNDFIEDVKLLVWLRKLHQKKMVGPVKGLLDILEPFIEFFLKNGFPSVFLFNVFKLKHALDKCYATGACKYFKD